MVCHSFLLAISNSDADTLIRVSLSNEESLENLPHLNRGPNKKFQASHVNSSFQAVDGSLLSIQLARNVFKIDISRLQEVYP